MKKRAAAVLALLCVNSASAAAVEAAARETYVVKETGSYFGGAVGESPMAIDRDTVWTFSPEGSSTDQCANNNSYACYRAQIGNLEVSEGKKLTFELKGNALGTTDWPYSLAVSVDCEGEGCRPFNLVMTGGAMAHLGPQNEWERAVNLTGELLSEVDFDVYKNVRDMLVISRPLLLDAQSRIALGQGADAAQNDAQLFVGKGGALMVDTLALREAGADAVIEAQGGNVSINFEPGAYLLLGDPFSGEEADRDAMVQADAVLPLLLKGDATVTGLDSLIVQGLMNGELYEGGFSRGEDGSIQLLQKPWAGVGAFSQVADAISKMVTNGTASAALTSFFAQHSGSEEFSHQLIYQTLMGKALGTTTAMDSLMAEGSLQTVRSVLSPELSLPVSVDILRRERSGEFTTFDLSVRDYRNGEWTRESEGIALGIDGRYRSWLAGARLSYEDTDVSYRADDLLQHGAGVKAESTVLAVTLYAGKRYDWGSITGEVAWAGGEDKVSQNSAGTIWVGSDRIERRAVSVGTTGTWVPEAWGGWQPAFSLGLHGIAFLKTDYDIQGNGETLWRAEEDERFVAALTAGAHLSRIWRFEKEDSLRLDLRAGLRARAGDLDIRQTVSAGDARSSLETDDLSAGEAYAGLDVRAKWKGSVFGIGAYASAGENGDTGTELRANCVFEF